MEYAALEVSDKFIDAGGYDNFTPKEERRFF